ncbi:hypothetical protein [Ensifer sp. MJa1]|uniref:hypothetical protein n=1 Tax=Ensifer sp. MJa1 TaxID=2919888 RepID=UPI00300A041C
MLFITPTIAASVYYTFIAANQYLSEARFTVKSSEGSGLQAFAGISSILGGGPSTDAAIVAEYIQSRAVIEEVGKKFDLRAVFTPGTNDIFAELGAGATAEDLLDYWERQVKVSVEQATGLVTLRVRTFNPEDSLNLSNELVRISERMVNELTGRNEANSLDEAANELRRTKLNLEAAVSAMRDARNSAGILDAEISAKAYSEIITALNIEATKLSVQIESLRRSSTTKGPQLRALEARFSSLNDQIGSYERKTASTSDVQDGSRNGSLADRSAVLSNKALELNIAQQEYAKASAAYELQRTTSERQRSYLLTYIQPRAAEDSLYPRRVLMSVAVLIVSLLMWGISAGLAVLVRDHTAA